MDCVPGAAGAGSGTSQVHSAGPTRQRAKCDFGRRGGAQRAANELARLTAGRVLRRGRPSTLHLPAKTEMVVFCKPTEMQRAMYEQGAKIVQGWTEGKRVPQRQPRQPCVRLAFSGSWQTLSTRL